MKEISSSLRISGAFATDIADRLVEHGLVMRNRGGKDRRKVIMCLTRAGWSCLKKLEDDRDELLFRCFAKMKIKDKKVFETAILKLLESMESIKEG